MRNAAYTMFQNDTVILKLWLSYYSRWFETLFVFGNNTKLEYGELEDLKRQFPFTFKRVPSLPDTVQMDELIQNKQKELLKDHEWVLYSDCDEIIASDPRYYRDLRGLMRENPNDFVHCEAYNILQMEDEPRIDYSEPYLPQRKYWAKDIDYNKPLLSRVPLRWAEGRHRRLDEADVDTKKISNTGLFLLHLKYADLNAEGRDFGPHKTHVHDKKISEGMKVKEEIPENIRSIL